jgi:hypothetical protein
VSLVPEDCLLEDQRGAQWPLDAGVMREVQRFRGAHTVRLVRREEEDADDEREEIAEQDTLEEEAEDEPAVGDLMALLNAANAGDQRAEGDEGGGGEEGLAAAPGLLDDDSDSDDDGKRGALRTSLLSASPCSQRPLGPRGEREESPRRPDAREPQLRHSGACPTVADGPIFSPHLRLPLLNPRPHPPSSPPICTPYLRPCRQREVYVEPEIDRPALILEMLLHITFLMLMTYACMDKRIIAEAFYLYQAA